MYMERSSVSVIASLRALSKGQAMHQLTLLQFAGRALVVVYLLFQPARVFVEATFGRYRTGNPRPADSVQHTEHPLTANDGGKLSLMRPSCPPSIDQQLRR